MSAEPIGPPDPETMARMQRETTQLRLCFDYAIALFEADIERLHGVIATLKEYRPK